ncbi:hypothetical protein B0H13DRAFT_1936305 [Mycena leptocephala]|nr:hypothetical protein B0H13DRAFT_1936305 [Mycena leptocephala]
MYMEEVGMRSQKNSEDGWEKRSKNLGPSSSQGIKSRWPSAKSWWSEVAHFWNSPRRRKYQNTAMKWDETYEALTKRENKPGNNAIFYGVQQSVHQGNFTPQHRGGVHMACLWGWRVTYRGGARKTRAAGITEQDRGLPAIHQIVIVRKTLHSHEGQDSSRIVVTPATRRPMIWLQTVTCGGSWQPTIARMMKGKSGEREG